MSWVDNRHNASEKEVAELQKVEENKIMNSKNCNGSFFKQLELDKQLYDEEHYFKVGYKTDQHVFSSYGYRTDYYF